MMDISTFGWLSTHSKSTRSVRCKIGLPRRNHAVTQSCGRRVRAQSHAITRLLTAGTSVHPFIHPRSLHSHLLQHVRANSRRERARGSGTGIHPTERRRLPIVIGITRFRSLHLEKILRLKKPSINPQTLPLFFHPPRPLSHTHARVLGRGYLKAAIKHAEMSNSAPHMQPRSHAVFVAGELGLHTFR